MLAMQYSIPLPVNYDAAKIRERVESRRALFDGHKGLVHKSFVYNEQNHIYAPFYVWRDVTEARNFLVEDLFQGVVESFSRPRIRSWVVLSMTYGDKGIKPAYARREIDLVAPEERLSRFAAEEKAAQEALAKMPGLYFHLTALDADRWEVMRFSLWAEETTAPKAHSDVFQEYGVLHVSEPV